MYGYLMMNNSSLGHTCTENESRDLSLLYTRFWRNMHSSQEVKATESIVLWMNWLAKDDICLQWSMTQSERNEI